MTLKGLVTDPVRLPGLPRKLSAPRWVFGFIGAVIVGTILAVLLTGGSSSGSAPIASDSTVAQAQETTTLAPASAPPASVNTERSSAGGQETAPAEQSVFLPLGTKTDNLFVGVGTRSEDEQLISIVQKDINSHRDAGELAIHLGLGTAAGLAENNLNPLAIDSVPERLRGVVENPDVLQGVGAAFLSYDGSGSQPEITRVVVSQPSGAEASGTEEISFVVTLYRAYSYGGEEQHEYDARAVPRQDNKGWLLTGWCARTGYSLYCS